MASRGRRSRQFRRLALATACATMVTLAPAAGAGPSHLDPAALPRGEDPSVAHLVRDTIRDGAARVAATTRGRHDALWVVDGGYLVRDYDVGPRRLIRLSFIDPAGHRRVVAQSRDWIDVAVSESGTRLALRRPQGPTGLRSVVSVEVPASGQVLARRTLRLANLVAVTETRVLLGRRLHWHHPATQWWNYGRDRLHAIAGQAAQWADVGHDRVAFAAPADGEFCNRVATLSHPGRTLWRSCAMAPHQWSPDGTHAIATRAYFDAAGTDRWWVLDGRTGSPGATIAGRLDWDAAWEDDEHFLTLAQGDAGGAAIVRCDLGGVCERASRVWEVPVPAEPSLYYASPPVVLAGR